MGQIHLRLPKGSVEGLVSLHRGFTKVPPRLRKFRDLSGLLGQIRQKVVRKVPHHFFKTRLAVPQCFFRIFSQQR